jgi:dihydrofolate reductase/thymidylate synthase
MITVVLACDRNFGIALNNAIPWDIELDRQFFYDHTLDSVVIMGLHTWLTLPDTHRSLPKRITIVLSTSFKQADIITQNSTGALTYVVPSLSAAMELCNAQHLDKIVICGGVSVYVAAIEQLNIDAVHVTQIHHDYQCDKFVNIPELLHKNHIANASQKEYTFELLDNKSGQMVLVSFMKWSLSFGYDFPAENVYIDGIYDILRNGHQRDTRNANVISTFGKTLTFDISESFPLLTTKRVFFKGIVEELLFFLRGDTNTTHLSQKGVKIWEPNTSREFLDKHNYTNYIAGDMGPMYGYQWRHFNETYNGCLMAYTKGYDQLDYCIHLLKTDPYSRRIMMTTYNPLQAHEGVLYPCHGIAIMFYVDKMHRLSCMMTQRSADYICGVPFNIASYALLVYLLCEIINNDTSYQGKFFSPGKLILQLGDTHIYTEHVSAAMRQLLRTPKLFPKLSFARRITDLNDVTANDIR